MELTARQVAVLLNISESRLYRWISGKKMPVKRVGGQYRFNRAKLIEWAIANRITLSPTVLSEHDEGDLPVFRLDDALQQGGVFHQVKGADLCTVLEEIIALMPLPTAVDRQYLLQVLLARETLGSTGIGNGIAIPHVRNPIIMHITRPFITLCFLENPIEFNALDGKPVHTLFTIISPSSRTHLQVLSRLSFALRDPDFIQTVAGKADRESILSAAKRIETILTSSQTEPAS